MLKWNYKEKHAEFESENLALLDFYFLKTVPNGHGHKVDTIALLNGKIKKSFEFQWQMLLPKYCAGHCYHLTEYSLTN